MRNLKRALSLALASVMLVGMMVVGSSAASYPDVDDDNNVEAISVLNAVEVMIGNENGDFEPDKNVTRNEMAVIMAKLILGTYEADSYVGSHPFTDVPDWASKYVAACYSSGIIAGRSADTYDGSATVTAVEAAAMMLRALGYEDLSLGAAQWDQPVAAKANEINLFVGLNGAGNAAMNRDSVAKLALNTLQATMVTTVRDGRDITLPDGTTITAARRYELRTTNYAWENAIDDEGNDNGGYLQLGEYLYKGKLTRDNDSDDYGMPAITWAYDGKEVITTAEEAERVWTTGIEDITLDDLYKALGSKTGALAIYENGTDADSPITPTKGSSTKSLAAYKGATIYAVDTHENGEADDTDPDGIADRLCVVYPYLAKVTKVTDATSTADRKITLEVWNKGIAGSTTGVTFDTEDFEKDDYVLVYPDMKIADSHGNAASLTGHIIDVKPVETAVGKISAVSGTQGRAVTALTIDGTKYTVGGDKLATKGLLSSKVVADDTYSFTSETTLYLSNGYVLGAEGTGGAKDISNIVYVTHAAYRPVGEYGQDDVYRAQVIRMDGTVEILKCNDASGEDTNSDTLTPGFYSISETSGKYDFTPAVAYSSIDNSTAYFGKDTVNAAYTMKADDKVVDLTSAPDAYLNSNTRIMYVKDSLGDLKTSMTLGPVRQTVEAGAKVLLSKDGSNYIVEAIIIDGEKADASDEVVYVKAAPEETLADSAKSYKYWDATTGEEHIVPVKNTNAPSDGFATYSVDKDGYYKFTAVADGDGTANKDGSHPITEAITLYETWLTEATQLTNADAANATIINATGEKDNDNLSLKDIADADDLAGVVYVVDEKVIAIVVTSYTETVLSTDADITAFTVAFTKNTTDGDAVIASDTLSAAKDAVTTTNINATFGAITTGSLKNGDKIDVTARTVSAGASVSATAGEDKITFTWNGTQWNGTGKIVVIPASGEGDKVTYNPGTCKSSDAKLKTDPINGTTSETFTTNGTATAAVDAQGNGTIKIVKPTGGTPAADNTVTYTMEKNFAGATGSVAVTITYAADDGSGSPGWTITTSTITITAEDGTTEQAYTVSFQ